MAPTAPGLSVGEWATLALVAECPTHGFAISRALAPDGEIGAVWSLPRPLVYRAVDTLGAKSLVREQGVEPGARGPRRTVLAATPKGRRRLQAWLDEPVEHVREVRTMLMLKLLFLERAGRDRDPLLRAQRSVLARTAVALEQRLRAAEGFERTLALWRLESTRAAARFVEVSLDDPSRPGNRDGIGTPR